MQQLSVSASELGDACRGFFGKPTTQIIAIGLAPARRREGIKMAGYVLKISTVTGIRRTSNNL
jgi:hypothetical protein